MFKNIWSWLSLAGFTAAAGYFWEKGNLEVAVGVVGIIVTIILALVQNNSYGEKKRNTWIRSFFRGQDFKKQYLTQLRYQNRDFDIKGLSTQTKYTLELEQVFVDLKLQPQAAHKATADPLQNVPLRFRKDSYPVWRFFTLLSDEKAQNPKIVIVGPPGSGKTTLLKHMTLLLATATPRDDESKTKIRKIPVIIFLRDYINDIVSNPSIVLSEIIDANARKLDLTVPPNWFSDKLKKGECLILLDGLDEVAEPPARRKMVSWMEHQIHVFPKNAFIVTSRPHGYRENPMSGVAVLEVMPFNRAQIDSFVQRWYLANEIKSHAGDDPGVRMSAKSGADDLLRRLEKNATLMELAVNPLLLTMIATVHRYRSALPGRRVELYKEICEVFLGKRQESKGLSIDMVPAQKQTVLQTLAYEMMDGNIREVRKPDAIEIIRKPLAMVAPTLDPDIFLKSIEQQTGLLLERELGIYSFAHKTFQEYLTSMYILEKNLESELYDRIKDDWWHEVIKLYSAQTDATKLITVCLDQDPPSSVALSLAIQCLEEAKQVKPELRDITERILLENAEDKDPELRKIIAQALLSNRIKHLVAVSPSIFIDTKPLTNAEFQVFVDDMLWRGKGDFHPMHWPDKSFPAGTAHMPAVGLTPLDALAFCEWLTELHSGSGEWYFRLPIRDELSSTNYSGKPRPWILRDFDRDDPATLQSIELWKGFASDIPIIPDHIIQKAAQADLKSVISTLRVEGRIINEITDDTYIKFIDVLRKLLRNSSKADKFLMETADRLYKKINQPPFSQPVDFCFGQEGVEAYDQAISDIIQRLADPAFEAAVLTSIGYFGDLLTINPRLVSRYRPLITAFALELLTVWSEKHMPMFVSAKTDGFQRKVNYLVDQYIDHVIVLARRSRLALPFEALIFVKEVKEKS